jgi:uncharacterized sporulation protein YeaH/YhbH (DUF444 family)
VKRLRDSFVYDQQHYAPDPLVAEAADTIEAQAAEIEELKSWKAAEDAHHHAMRAGIKRLREALRGMVEYSRFNERWQDAHPEYVRNSIRALGETE